LIWKTFSFRVFYGFEEPLLLGGPPAEPAPNAGKNTKCIRREKFINNNKKQFSAIVLTIKH
jgi:hypothetical protein